MLLDIRQLLSFRGKTVLDELKLISSLLLYFLLVLTKGSLIIFDKKYLFKMEFKIVSFGSTFLCRKNTLDFSYIFPLYEKELLNYFKIKSGIFFDIGAHVGRYSLLVAKKLEKGCVYCFEPSIMTYDALIKNIKLNNFKNIIPNRLALSNKKGFYKLFLSKYNEGQNSLIHSNMKEPSINIETTTLDDFIKDNRISTSEIVLIKIDVEGAEYLVLEGSKELIQNNSPIIIFESNNPYSLFKCKKLLNRCGFIIKKINSNNYCAVK